MRNEGILEKVKAILEKAIETSDNINDIGGALIKTAELICEYQIGKRDFILFPSDFGQTDLLLYKKRGDGNKWEFQLLKTLCEVNLCKLVGTKVGGWDSSKITRVWEESQGIRGSVFGADENREVVEVMFLLLRDFIRRFCLNSYGKWRKKTREVMSRKLKKDFVKRNWKQFERNLVIPTKHIWETCYLIGVCEILYNSIKRYGKQEEDIIKYYEIIREKHNNIIDTFIKKVFGNINFNSMQGSVLVSPDFNASIMNRDINVNINRRLLV